MKKIKPIFTKSIIHTYITVGHFGKLIDQESFEVCGAALVGFDFTPDIKDSLFIPNGLLTNLKNEENSKTKGN